MEKSIGCLNEDGSIRCRFGKTLSKSCEIICSDKIGEVFKTKIEDTEDTEKKTTEEKKEPSQ